MRSVYSSEGLSMLKTKVFAPHLTFKCERQFGAEPGNRGRARISLLGRMQVV